MLYKHLLVLLSRGLERIDLVVQWEEREWREAEIRAQGTISAFWRDSRMCAGAGRSPTGRNCGCGCMDKTRHASLEKSQGF